MSFTFSNGDKNYNNNNEETELKIKENINFLTEPYKLDEIYYSLNPIVKLWFKLTFKEPSPPQYYSIINILKKRNSLISSPTGSGKTLSAFLSILNELINYQANNSLKNQVYCIYISPLKALANDIEKNLTKPLEEMDKLLKLNENELRELIKEEEKNNKRITEEDITNFLEEKKKINKIKITKAIRTGDTTSYEKSKMLKNPPHILITTPESFAITLISKKFKEHLKNLEWTIIDEAHALADSKRGAHLSLSLELLNSYKEFTRIGLSATVSPLTEIAKFLVGLKINTYNKLGERTIETRECDIIDVQFIKELDFKVITPIKDLIKTTSTELTKSLYKLLHKLIQKKKITLIFTNTRAGTERVINQLKTLFPEYYNNDNIGAHHGSLSKEERKKIENKLKEGKIKVVVSSTSLELGIDIGDIEQVILLGSPKSVSRALQRVGRAGHKLQETSYGRVIPLDRDDLVEVATLLKDALEKKIDYTQIIFTPLDVLAQQIFGFVIESPKTLDELIDIIYKSYNYYNLNRGDLLKVIEFIEGKYEELEDNNVYGKIRWDRETKLIYPRGKLARTIYLTNVGTIPEQTGIRVKEGDKFIGTLDEYFLERFKKGDIFTLGGKTYMFMHSRGMTIQVREAPNLSPTIPNWYSEQLPLSFELAQNIQKLRGIVNKYFNEFELRNNLKRENEVKREVTTFLKSYLYIDENTSNSIYEYFKEQYLYAILPTENKILIEIYKDEKEWKKYFIFHSMNGRRVNDVLSRVIAYLISKVENRDSEILVNDNTFAVIVDYNININLDLILSKLKTVDLYKVAESATSNSEILKRRFRQCATRSLMILKNYKGKKKNVGRQQLNSMFLLKTVRSLGEDFPILKETYREILEDVMDIKNAKRIIEKLKKGGLRIELFYDEIPSPFAFNLILQGNSDIIKMESKQEFLRRFYNQVLAKIELDKINRNK